MVHVLEKPTSQLSPEPLYQLAMGFTYTRALLAAHRLGIFEVLQEHEKTADQVAEEKNLSASSTELLLNACTALKMCTKTGDRYAAAPIIKRFLIKEEP